MLSSDKAIVEGLRSASLVGIGAFDEAVGSVKDYFGLKSQIRSLRLKNTRLAYQNYQFQEALLENLRLKKLLQLKQKSEYRFIPAKIVGFSPQDFVTGFILASSQYREIPKNSAVITAEGLVGKVVKITKRYAICQNLLDPNSRVSVRIQRNRELGIVSWDGGNGLLLENIPNTVEVKEGDVLFTSGMSQIYPPGIKVGVVVSVQKEEQQLFQKIHARPAVNFNKLEEVFILKERPTNDPRK